MKHLLLLISTTLLVLSKGYSQHIILYKTENIICDGDTFWIRTYVNKKEKDTTYTYTPDIPEKCIQRAGEKTYLYVHRMPYPLYDLDSYLATIVKYPDELKHKQKTGHVAVQFLVNSNGSITNAKVVTSLHPVADSIALETIINMPRWRAGHQGGKPVPVLYTYKVHFKP